MRAFSTSVVPRIGLLVALCAVAGCRDDAGSPLDASGNLPFDGFLFDGGDDGPPPLSCPATANCLACCTGQYESGALDFTAALQPCACQPQVCATACKKTLCGSELILDAACRTCLDGARAPGGACHQAEVDCMGTQGACGLFENCVDSCPR